MHGYVRIMGVRSLLAVLVAFSALSCLGCEATMNGASSDDPSSPTNSGPTTVARNRQTLADRQQDAMAAMESKARIRRTGTMRGHFKQTDTILVVGMEPECQNLFSNKITVCKDPAFGVPVYIQVMAQNRLHPGHGAEGALVPVQIGVTDERGLLRVDLDQVLAPNVAILPTTARLSCAPMGPGFVEYGANGAPPNVCQKLSNEADLPAIDLRPVNSNRDDRAWAQSNSDACSTPTTVDSCARVQWYIATFKGAGNHSDEANTVMQQATPALTRLLDEKQWSSTDPTACASFSGNDPDGSNQVCQPVADYLKAYPNGAHADQARQALAQGKKIHDQLVARAAAAERQEQAAEASRQRAADAKRREQCMGVCRIQCSGKLHFDECFAGCPALCQ